MDYIYASPDMVLGPDLHPRIGMVPWVWLLPLRQQLFLILARGSPLNQILFLLAAGTL